LTLALSAFSANVLAADVDADAAQALAKKSNCFKCHAVDKRKTASLQRGCRQIQRQGRRRRKLVKHVTTGPKIKIDGKEEEHEIVKSKNDAESPQLGALDSLALSN